MQRLLFLLFILFASAWLGIFLFQQPGFLILIYKPWVVQAPLWFVVLATIIFLALFYLCIVSIDQIKFLWFRLKNWHRIRKEHLSYSKTQHGLALVIEGRYKKAEQLLLSGMNQTVEPLINYLAAAKSAQEQQAFERRDAYLAKAYQEAPHAKLAIGLVKAELSLQAGQIEEALQILRELQQESPKHPRVLKLLEKCYVYRADWQNLHLLIPSLRKAKLVQSKSEYEKHIYTELLPLTAHASQLDQQRLWLDLPRHMQKDPDVIYAYISQLMQRDVTRQENDEIASMIKKALKTKWHGGLVLLYSRLTFEDLNKQLVIADAWLKAYGPHAETYLLLAKLCAKTKLWGKAKDYFEKCLAFGPNIEASRAYGDLLQSLNENQAALKIYRDALAG